MADISTNDAPAGAPKPKRRMSEAMVMIAMAIVTLAFGAGLYMQVGLTLWLAFIAALSMYVSLLTLHALVRRGDTVENLNFEIRRLEAEVARLSGHAPGNAMPAAVAPGLASAPGRPAMPQQRMTVPTQPAPARPPSPEQREDKRPLDPQQATVARQLGDVLPANAQPPSLTPAAGRPAAAEAPSAPIFGRQADLPPPIPAQEPWSFRPAEPQLQAAPGRAAADQPPPIPMKVDPAFDRIAASIRAPDLPAMPPEQPAAAPKSSIRDTDVEVIQGLIKKLADEVNAAEAAAPPPARSSNLTDAAIETSLEALRATAESMRDVAAEPARPEPRFSPPPVPAVPAFAEQSPPPLSEIAPWPAPITSSRPTQARINALSEAITARRADVLLEPILGLDDQRPRHYEVLLRLRSAAGNPLGSESLIEELRETGLLPLLDCTRINRVANVARRLADRGQSKAVFSEFSTESLADDHFLNDFANAYHERDSFAGQLVLTFTQAEIRALAHREWSTLDDMRDLGFRFAMQSITDLDMDFETLRARGFEFVKLDADVFLQGLPAPGGMIPAADICRHLAQLGLTLIVGSIDDETKLARIFGFGALFGQGQLFGGPRLVKLEETRPGRAQPSAHAAA